MKQIRRISRYLCIGAIFLGGTACSDEYIIDDIIPPEINGSMLHIPLYMDGEEFERPVTRTTATDENNTQGFMPWVLVFRGDSNSAVFFEASRAKLSDGKLSVELTGSANKSRLLIIANPPDKFFDGTTNNRNMDQAMLTAKLSGKTYSQALTILNMQKLNAPQSTAPYAGGYLPMSGSVILNTINDQTTIGTPAGRVQLTRVVAKVTIENSAPDFIVEGFTVIGAKQYGRFMHSAPAIAVGNVVNYLASSSADPVAGISDGTKPVYIYESSVGETSVIVKGKYKSVTSYYRLLFKNATNREISIIRNKWYQFKIKEVKISGYKTLQEAVAAPPSGIMAELLITDQSSMELTDNGQYYIGLSNSALYTYSNTAHSNLVAATITTNAPAGVKAGVEIVSATPAGGMTVSPVNIVPNGTVKGTDVKISLTKQFTGGTLKITVGNLVRLVTVERKPVMTWRENNLTFTPGYVSAKIESQGNGGNEWLSLSTDSVKYVRDEAVRPDKAGSIYLRARENDSGTTRSEGVVYLARKDAEGHVKLFITQMAVSPR